MYDVCMQLCQYIDLQILKYQLCKYESMEIIIEVNKCAGMQIFKCVGMPLSMYASIQICKKVSMKD